MKRLFDSLVTPFAGTRFLALDGLRGLLALAVMLNHLPIASAYRVGAYGSVAVSAFFALSAFCLFVPYVEGKKLSLVEYSVRRVSRIYPMWLVALLLGIVAAVATASPITVADVLTHLLFVHSWNADTLKTLIAPAWSLPTEVQFYFLLPLLAAILTSTRRIVVGVVCAFLLQLLPFYIGIGSPINLNWPFWGTPFFCGMLAATFIHRSSRYWSVLGTIALAAILIYGAWPADAKWGEVWSMLLYLYPRSLLMSVCSGVLIASLAADQKSLLASVFAFKPLRAIGIAGYSLFLIHAPLFVIMGSFMSPSYVVIIGPVLAIGLSFLTYLYIEVPAVRYGRSLCEGVKLQT